MNHTRLRLRRLGIDTYRQPVLYMRHDSPICRAEGFEAQSMVEVKLGDRSLVAVLNVVRSPLLGENEASLSEVAWRMLGAQEGDEISFAHPPPLDSFGAVRGKLHGRRFDKADFVAIASDIAVGRYSDAHIASFLTACAGHQLDRAEMTDLTHAMVAAGERIVWNAPVVLDKHSVGGLPGNRTTPIVVAIVAAAGFTIPKTSSRAITSPAGTADTMEQLAPVELDLGTLRRVVEREGGCIAWGGSVRLSPVDDVLIRVAQPLDLDGDGQLVASILSKKAAAGSTHVLIDIPVGATAKVRTPAAAVTLGEHLEGVGRSLGISVRAVPSDGSQPIGRGVGPALEALDVLAVLRGDADAPPDLRTRALQIAAGVLALAPAAGGNPADLVSAILSDGRAWRKFQRICEAQGGMREPGHAPHTRPVVADREGTVLGIDNRRLARLAKLAGAPTAPTAGLVLHTRVGTRVAVGQPLVTLHAEAPGELAYALAYADANPDILEVR